MQKKYFVLTIAFAIIILGIILFFAKSPGTKTSSSNETKSETKLEDRFLGSPDAEVIIIEYSDFQCPACQMAEEIAKQITDFYGNKIKFVFRHFPLPFHQNSFKAAEAAECAGDQGKFWEYKKIIFENQYNLSINDLKKYAKELGLDQTSFDKCLDSDQKEAKVKRDQQEGEKQRVEATPTFFVNNKKIEGALPFEEFKKEIDALLEK